MLLKTAFKNFRRHFPNRLIYFVAIALLVMVAYDCLATFTNPLLQDSASALAVVSLLLLFIVIIIFSLLIMFYANRFFIHQHQQEFGILILTGFTRGQLAWVFFIETFLAEILSLGLGLILGLLTNKLFGMFLLRVMGIQAQTNFWFSALALLITAFIYVIVFGLLGLSGWLIIARLHLVDLLHQRHFESAKPRHRYLASGLALLGPLMLGLSYLLMFRFNWKKLLQPQLLTQTHALQLMAILLSLSAGIWFIFRNFLPALCQRLQVTSWAYRHQAILELAMSGRNFADHHQSQTLTTLFVMGSILVLGLGTLIYDWVNHIAPQTTALLADIRPALGLVLFVTNLLAILLSFVWASVFSLRKLAEVNVDQFDFITLYKLGIEPQMLLTISNRQNCLIFLTPVLLGVINGLIFLQALSSYYDWRSRGILALSILVVLGIYWCFYLFTAFNYRRILRQMRLSTQTER